MQLPLVIFPDFPLESTGFFPWKHLIYFLVLKMKDFGILFCITEYWFLMLNKLT